MSPDQLKIQELETKVATLERQMREFLSAAELSPQIIRSIGVAISSASSKSASSENQSVNEAGVSSYSVLKPPDRFIRIGDNNVPAYDS